jgi:lipopolysaccharide transport system ATP-binding protein
MAEPRIRFHDVRKSFRTRNRSDSLRDAVPRFLARIAGRAAPVAARPERFTALDGISFEVRPGEALGIIGANGAGKSTSLRLAAGIYGPDGGTVEVKGRVSALIELSAGFHPDLSGRENIHLLGALLGLRTSEVNACMDPIVAFADIGDFLEAPVRTYSTGMAVRLGFSVAAHVPAESLLVDEVLAVGDIDFQVKCLRRMAERRSEGASILFVSHNLRVMEQFCDRVLFIHHGKVVEEGAPRTVIATFRRTMTDERRVDLRRESASPRMRRGSGQILLEDVRVAGDGPDGAARTDGPLVVEARWSAPAPVARPVFGAQIHSLKGLLVAECTTLGGDRVPATLHGTGALRLEVPSLPLLPGEYDVSVFARDASGLVDLDLHQQLYLLRVSGESREGDDGVLRLDQRWTVASGGPAKGA